MDDSAISLRQLLGSQLILLFEHLTPKAVLNIPAALTLRALDVLQQRIDRRAAPRRIRAFPSTWTEAHARVLFGLLPKVVDRVVDNGRAGALGDGELSA